jgi:hypothetical protein
VLGNRHIGCDILGDIAAPPGLLQYSLERDEYLPRCRARHGLKQIIAKGVDARRSQLAKLLIAQASNDVGDQLSVSPDRCAFAPLGFDVSEPIIGGLRNRDAFVGRCVNALIDVDRNFGLACIGVFLALERLDMSRAIGDVIDNPSFLGLAGASNPFPFSD